MHFQRSLKILNVSRNIIFKDSFRCCNTLQECVHSNSFIQQEYDISQKLLKVAVIGMPNAGKSTFINYLMDRKVCPTSSKIHTTRKKTTAIFTEGNSQIIFLDTPGLVTDRMRRKYNLESSFVKDSEICLKQADTVGVIHDVSCKWKPEQLDIKIIDLLEKHKEKPSFLVLNKVDILKSKRKLLELTRLLTMNCLDGQPIMKKKLELNECDNNHGWPYFKEVFMISALTGSGLGEVKDYLIKTAKPGKWMFPGDVWSNQTPEIIIVDTVKATLLDFLPQEIPYKMEPILELYEISEDKTISIVVLVKCISERVAKLVAGGSDGRLRQITEGVQRDLQNIFQTYVKITIVLESPKQKK
ncbi:hypothetical protein ILUMI_27156 [Ignelater luminosus]|uniref:GTPase Era, mitochondrial n=1 Tax=Ignelater luminosus TaxID=2038154 RepID=A0A8K0FVR2_IGNLU|nr:hypothetical protein ILUMI_27156 [Ignelater luminosus]